MIRLVEETVFTDTIKDINICLKGCSNIIGNLKQGTDYKDYIEASVNLDKICRILDYLTEMSFKEARIHTRVLQKNNKSLYSNYNENEE
jgi:hypothetical protein